MANIDYGDNANQRTPCVLVLDASGSMSSQTTPGKTRIDDLNEGIVALERELRADDAALVRVQLAIVIVGGPNNDAEILMDWTDATDFQAFPIRADGATPLGKGLRIALEMIDNIKKNNRSNGIPYTRPWMMVISDGEPTDSTEEWQEAVKECKAAEAAKKVIIFPVGVAGANLAALSQIAERPAQMLSGTKFSDLFIWLSASLSAASRSRPGDKIQLPSNDAWRYTSI